MMDSEKRELLRQAMEVQFRHQFYSKPEFTFLPSLGIRDIFQGFGNEEIGYIGFLHLKYFRKKAGEQEWAAIWYDTHEEGIEAQRHWFEDVPYNRGKMMHLVMQHIQNQANKVEIEEEEEKIILN
tara:strand:+ start:261 stop:635 length:375 start_codon:yes stop_codon:yes gene_type:complete